MSIISDELASAYGQVFVYVADDFAVQQRNGSYWRQNEPMTLLCLKMHLEGRWTLGTYLLDEYSRCMFAVFDADAIDGLARLATLAERTGTTRDTHDVRSESARWAFMGTSGGTDSGASGTGVAAALCASV